MLRYAKHGGACCGVAHVHGFDGASIEDLDRIIDEHFNHGNGNRILEAILSDRQVVTPLNPDRTFHASVVAAGGWPVILAARGFAIAENWTNSNTGRRCYRFVKLAGRDNTQTTLGSLDSRPLPFNWAGEGLTLRESAPVEIVRVPPVIAVGDTVRLFSDTRTTPVIGDVIGTPRDGYLRVRWRNGSGETVSAIPNLTKVSVSSLAVDISRPVEIYDPGTGRVIGPFNASVYRPAGHTEADGPCCQAAGTWFHCDTGEYGRRRPGGRFVRNVGDTHTRPLTTDRINIPPAPPAPAPQEERREVLTEYFAYFRSGRQLGPYETMEALRENNPRVLSFVTRRFFSDGTITTAAPARIPG